ncbi:MAG: hypothetical protein QM778_02880 [Myxococcales bacterium]
MTDNQVLFCPFCRESFEGRTTCPEHDLTLVDFAKLGPDPLEPDNMPEVIDETPLALVEPTFGRGYVAAGAFLNALALACNFVRGSSASPGVSTRDLAVTLPSLWTLGLVSFTLLFILQRRRTPRALRSVRVLVPVLAFVSPLTAAWAFHRLSEGVLVWSTGERALHPVPGLALYLIVLASALIFFGGLRLGVLPKRKELRV